MMNKHVRALGRLLQIIIFAVFMFGTPFMINDWVMSQLPADKASQLIHDGFSIHVTAVFWIVWLSFCTLVVSGLIKLKEFCYED